VSERADIKSADQAGLEGVIRSLDAPAWRVSQLVRWLYGRGVATFDEMTDLPAALRTVLAESFTIGRPEVLRRQVARDGTRKYLLGLSDGASVEVVGLPSADRLTVCFSTQAGCGMGCTFCATGRSGLIRNLTAGEIVDQVNLVSRDFGQRVSNAVGMGQGEPFANYDAVIAALRFMNAEDGCAIGARHLTVSTCGLIPGIARFATEPEQFTLAVSLHSAIQATRDRLMPGVRAYPLPALRDALAAYATGTGRRPTFEYALISGVNDTDAELDALVRFCGDLLCHVNLIPVNPVTGTTWSRPSAEVVRRFQTGLSRSGTETSVRVERGTDIDAACGQLQQRSAVAD
jgi:23S rRNA (adenine2503-C2)-methyltransferase